jgi:site-specific recombinase XerD
LRFWHYSYRTEQTYVEWIHRYLRFCRNRCDSGECQVWRHPRECGEAEIQAFLSHLANDRNVAASTQNQALNALVFLYREVLAKDLGEFADFARAKRPVRLPAVLTKDECLRLFERMQPPMKWIAELLFGSGMRLMECLRLRIKDVDFSRGLITVRSGKGDNYAKVVVMDRFVI